MFQQRGRASQLKLKNTYLAILILCEPTLIPGCSQNSGTEPRIWTKLEQEASKDTWFRRVSSCLFVLHFLTSCSVSTKLATWPSSFTPRTSNLVENIKREKEKLTQAWLSWFSYITLIISSPCSCPFTAQPRYYCCLGLRFQAWRYFQRNALC